MEAKQEYFEVVRKNGTKYQVLKCVCATCGHPHFIKTKDVEMR